MAPKNTLCHVSGANEHELPTPAAALIIKSKVPACCCIYSASDEMKTSWAPSRRAAMKKGALPLLRYTNLGGAIAMCCLRFSKYHNPDCDATLLRACGYAGC